MKIVSLNSHRNGKYGRGHEALQVRLPIGLSRALRKHGYNRVQVEVVEAGILLRPFTDSQDTRIAPAWDLPWRENAGSLTEA